MADRNVGAVEHVLILGRRPFVLRLIPDDAPGEHAVDVHTGKGEIVARQGASIGQFFEALDALPDRYRGRARLFPFGGDVG